jgi:hypothetical protein
MRTPRAKADKPEVLIVDSKGLRQAGIARLLEVWADVMGLSLKAVEPDVLFDTSYVPANCEMMIISLGDASIEGVHYQALIKSVREPRHPWLSFRTESSRKRYALLFDKEQ